MSIVESFFVFPFFFLSGSSVSVKPSAERTTRTAPATTRGGGICHLTMVLRKMMRMLFWGFVLMALLTSSVVDGVESDQHQGSPGTISGHFTRKV